MIARNPVKSHSLSLKLHKRAHYCIVLHRSDQHMVAWFQDPLEENIKAHSDVLGENHIFAPAGCEMEKPAKLFSCLKDLFFYGIGSLIPAASDIDRTAGEILINSISHRRSLRKRSACLIQIYFFHKITSRTFIRS